MKTYAYEISGGAARGQSWTTRGEVGITTPGAFNAAIGIVMRASFDQLTNGEAVYGHPGLGCDGPYTVTRMLIEEKSDDLAP